MYSQSVGSISSLFQSARLNLSLAPYLIHQPSNVWHPRLIPRHTQAHRGISPQCHADSVNSPACRPGRGKGGRIIMATSDLAPAWAAPSSMRLLRFLFVWFHPIQLRTINIKDKAYKILLGIGHLVRIWRSAHFSLERTTNVTSASHPWLPRTQKLS
jgi:hypothetical protein